ncbi:MAG: hypothetical protein KBD64_03520, partial [Gammaproteobacteria bacterium]|nr:hypothetical protein [Gammaproteobacteria bacterium]
MLITRWGDGIPTCGVDVSDTFDTTISFVIKYVSPEVGYCAFAGQDIPAGTDIAAYTGMIGEVSKSTSTQQSLYALQVDKDCCIDAAYAGNISRFFCHLPEAQDLASYNFSSVELRESVATSNAAHKVSMLSLSGGRVLPCLVLVAKRMIKAGEIIGFDYSLDYWRNLDKRPKFFANDGTILT